MLTTLLELIKLGVILLSYQQHLMHPPWSRHKCTVDVAAESVTKADKLVDEDRYMHIFITRAE